ncbi:MAG: hypothetical protein GSR72_04525 [Desulfurococcales archaeon]|nr:hypothetical protein [Desulfurococcales archaeon]
MNGIITVLQTVSLRESLKMAANDIVSALPNVIAILIILLAGYLIGTILGNAVSKIVDKLVEKPLSKTEIGKKYKEYGFDLSDFTGGVVKAYVFLVALIIALPYMNFTGQAYAVLSSIVYYLPKLLGGIVVLFYGLLLSNLLASFIGASVETSLSEEYKSISELLKNTVLIGMIAVVVTIALNMMMIGGDLIYTLILGFVIIALGAVITNTLFETLENYESFKDYIGYGKFLLYVIFIMVGLSAIFQAYPGSIAVLSRLAWGVAIAFAIMLIPLVFKLVKKMTREK